MTVDEDFEEYSSGEDNEEESEVQEFVLTRKRFTKLVEEYVSNHPDSTYMDAVLEVCEARSIDPYDISSLICKSLWHKIEAEAMRSNLLKGSNKSQELPI